MYYTKEQKKKAIDLYEKYGKHSVAVIKELGYPSNRHTLVKWYKNYKKSGKIDMYTDTFYTDEMKKKAIDFYLEHGKSITFTVQSLGYPSKSVFSKWIHEMIPDKARIYKQQNTEEETSKTIEKVKAVIESVTENKDKAESSAKKQRINKAVLQYLVKQMTDEKEIALPKKCNTGDLEKDNEMLKAENERLKKENFELQLMNDILTEAGKILKKDQGISLETLTNREKMLVIDTLRNRYQLKILLEMLNMAKSSYCYQESIKDYDKYSKERKEITDIFNKNNSNYGSRRIHLEYCKKGKTLSERVIRRIMHEENLNVINIKMKKYSSYKGEITPAVPNLVKRNFHADKPNKLWLTDITEFHIPAGKVYLSPLIDCHDGWVVKWTIGLSPSSELTNTMLKEAISTLKPDEKPMVHSDRGFHYRTPSWIKIMEDAELTRSMSKKGCTPDNSACEAFFGRLKNEFFYGRNWKNVSLDDFMSRLDEYIQWYNNERIKLQFKESIRDHRIREGLLAA